MNQKVKTGGIYEFLADSGYLMVSGAVLFALLTALGSFVRIPLPFSPVPITLQTFFVLLSGSLLGKKYGFISQFLFVGLGVAGIPIFAVPGGILGPTGGYLFSFLLIPVLCGLLIDNVSRSFISLLGIFFICSAIILALGSCYLSFYMNVDLPKAFYLGFLPFVAGDFLKSVVAAGIVFLTLKRD
ncbi:MAG: biotin transporter BioY [bacterium]|nr:biotin transporter BioY [bacterium]